MKTKAYGGIDPAELSRVAERLEQGKTLPQQKADQARDFFQRLPRDQHEKLFAGRFEELPKELVDLALAKDEQLQEAMTVLRGIDALVYPMKQLVAGLRYLESRETSGLDLYGVSSVLSTRTRMMTAIETVEKAFAAAGPEVEKQLPADQLALLKRNLAGEIEVLKAQEKDLKAKQPPPVQSYSSHSYAKPDPVPDPVRLTLAQVKDVASAAKAIEHALGAPGLAGEILAAAQKLDGDAAKRFDAALSGYAVLADTAANALDYGPVPPQVFAHPRDKRAHEARRYDAGFVAQSQGRQAKSKADMTADLKKAIADKDAPGSLERALVQGFIREAGFPAGTGADWNPKIGEVRKALDENVLVPLRCLYANVGRGGLMPYSPDTLAGMKKVLIDIAQAIAEGRYAEWRATTPEAAAQLGVLAGDAEKKAWLESLHLDGKTDPATGRKVSSHEAEGAENFWATKVGGPSHGFDAMPHCLMSLLANARTRIVMVEASDWHQTAARAYLRLLGGEGGGGLIYVEGMETDFPLRDTKLDRSFDDQLRNQVVDHAIEKAKATGAGLVFTYGYASILRDRGYPAKEGAIPMILHPSAGRNEASDSLGPHDWAQDQVQTVYPRMGAYVLTAAQVAAL